MADDDAFLFSHKNFQFGRNHNLAAYAATGRLPENIFVIPDVKARAEAAKFIGGLLNHPDQIERQRGSFEPLMGEAWFKKLQERALEHQDRLKDMLVQNAAFVRNLYPSPEEGIEGVSKRLQKFYDGCTEHWSTPQPVPGSSPRIHQQYLLKNRWGTVFSREYEMPGTLQDKDFRIEPRTAEIARLDAQMAVLRKTIHPSDSPDTRDDMTLIKQSIAWITRGAGAIFAVAAIARKLPLPQQIAACLAIVFAFGAANFSFGKKFCRSYADEIYDIYSGDLGIPFPSAEAIEIIRNIQREAAERHLRHARQGTIGLAIAVAIAAVLLCLPISGLWCAIPFGVLLPKGMQHLGLARGNSLVEKLAEAAAARVTIGGLNDGPTKTRRAQFQDQHPEMN